MKESEKKSKDEALEFEFIWMRLNVLQRKALYVRARLYTRWRWIITLYDWVRERYQAALVRMSFDAHWIDYRRDSWKL